MTRLGRRTSSPPRGFDVGPGEGRPAHRVALHFGAAGLLCLGFVPDDAETLARAMLGAIGRVKREGALSRAAQRADILHEKYHASTQIAVVWPILR
jgi:hypothetical protein